VTNNSEESTDLVGSPTRRSYWTTAGHLNAAAFGFPPPSQVARPLGGVTFHNDESGFSVLRIKARRVHRALTKNPADTGSSGVVPGGRARSL
jgi:hypothetical protein